VSKVVALVTGLETTVRSLNKSAGRAGGVAQ